MYELPTSIELHGESFKIREKGDFRMILHLFNIMNDKELTEQEQVLTCLLVFYDKFVDVDDIMKYPYVKDAVLEMFKFINCGQPEESKPSSVRLIDWEQDSVLITSAVNNVAGKEIRSEKYLHWWTFMSYFMAIGECSLSQIVGIRYKIAHNEKLEKHEKKFKHENPQYFNIDLRSKEQREADAYVRSLWNGDSE